METHRPPADPKHPDEAPAVGAFRRAFGTAGREHAARVADRRTPPPPPTTEPEEG